jgi:hypothetical protein
LAHTETNFIWNEHINFLKTFRYTWPKYALKYMRNFICFSLIYFHPSSWILDAFYQFCNQSRRDSIASRRKCILLVWRIENEYHAMLPGYKAWSREWKECNWRQMQGYCGEGIHVLSLLGSLVWFCGHEKVSERIKAR